MSIILARSGFGASLWLGFTAAVLGAVGVSVAAIGMVKVAQGFRDYRSEAATLSQLDRRLSRGAALRFVGLQLVAIAVLLAIAALVALVLPGMAVQAAFVTVFLTAAVWAAQPLGGAGQSVGASLERLVGRVGKINLAQSIAFWRRPYVDWVLAGRVAHARHAGASDPMTLSYLNALDSDGVVRPNLHHAGPSVAVDARWRLVSLLPVFVTALPFAVIAWVAAALLPDNWVPRLPSPAALLELENPSEPLDDVMPPPEPDQAALGVEGGEDGGSGGQGNAGADGSGGDGGQQDSPPSGSTWDQSGAGGEGSSAPEGGERPTDGSGAQAGAGPDVGEGARGASPDAPTTPDGAGQADAEPAEQGEVGTAPSDTGTGQAGGEGEGQKAPSAPPAQDQGQSGTDEDGTKGGEGGPAADPNAQQPDPAAQTDGSPAPPAEAGTSPVAAAPQEGAAAEDGPSPDGPADLSETPDRGGAEATQPPLTASGKEAGQPSSESPPSQDVEILDGPPPADGQPVGLVATDEAPPPDAQLVELSALGTAEPVFDQDEVLYIGSPQALFAEPGLAPDTVETRLDADAVLPPDLPSGPLARQRLPAWVSDLMTE